MISLYLIICSNIFQWEGPLGTVAIVGISTKDAILQCHGYAPLLGWDDQSWGWNLVDNYLLHNGDAGNFPLLTNAPKYQVGEKIKVILDCDSHCLAFEKNNEFLGVAFRNLPGKKLYPTITVRRIVKKIESNLMLMIFLGGLWQHRGFNGLFRISF